MLVPFIAVELEPNSYHLLVKVKINASETYLVIDTGASSSVIDNVFFEHVEVEQVGQTVAYSFTSDNVNVSVVKCQSVEFEPGIEYKDISFVITDLSKLREMYKKITGYDIAGLLGSNFLFNYCSSINFKKNTLSLNKHPNRSIIKINNKNQNNVN